MKTKREARPGPAGGYTLIELAAVLAIVGVLTSLALPAFGGMVLDTRRAGIVNALLLTFRLAQSEADTHQRSVVVCGVRDIDRDGVLAPSEQVCAGRNWTFGWMLALWNDRDADGTVGTTEVRVLKVFQTEAGGRLSVTAGHFAGSVGPSGTILFKASGRRASNGTVTFCDRRGPKAARAVIFSSAGRARVSARNASGGALACPLGAEP